MNNPLKSSAIDLLELSILLILPLPFLHLNIYYLITAIVIILLSKYLRKEKWSDYGLIQVNKRDIILAVFIGIVLGFIDNFLIEPMLIKMTGSAPDLSSYEGVKGSIPGLIGMMALGWIVGGFFEEIFFRGYLFNRLRPFFKNPLIFRIVAIILVSIVFGFAHNYQGITGIIGTFIFSVVLGLLYFFFRGNVGYLILVHGFDDMVGIIRLYLGY